MDKKKQKGKAEGLILVIRFRSLNIVLVQMCGLLLVWQARSWRTASLDAGSYQPDLVRASRITVNYVDLSPARPCREGVNFTVTLQLALGVSVAGQVLVWMKSSPTSLIDVMVSVLVSEFVMV